MNTYDVIVVGAGNGGLISALKLAKEGKKVLILEANGLPGGAATSFIRGRFEFDASLTEINNYGNKENPGKLYKLFEELGLNEKIEMINLNSTYHIYSANSLEDFIMPFGIDAYLNKLEEYVPDSKEKVKKLFTLLEEVEQAMSYIWKNKGNVDFTYLNETYPNFTKVASSSTLKVFDALEIPTKAQYILGAYWIYLGSPLNKLSFVHYGLMLYSILKYGIQVPKKRSYDLSLAIANEIETQGGNIRYFSLVDKIIKTDDGFKIILDNEEEYYASKVICDISPNTVYGKLYQSNIPSLALKLTNSRILGGRCLAIYVGLNQSADALGLNEYNYIIYDTLNSTLEYENMSKITNTSCQATVLNNAINYASPTGTCIMKFTTTYFGDIFDKVITEENYFNLKNELAKKIIEKFETTTGILITPYIEEIEIATPVTFARYTKHPDGVVYGYKGTDLDNLIPRLLNLNNENYIPDLYFCGSFATLLNGYSSTYLSGFLASQMLLENEAKK